MKNTAEELADKTRAYWILSSVWNNKMKNSIPMGVALNSCTTILNMTNCERPLARRVWELQEEFIEGSSKSPSQETKILPMKQGA